MMVTKVYCDGCGQELTLGKDTWHVPAWEAENDLRTKRQKLSGNAYDLCANCLANLARFISNAIATWANPNRNWRSGAAGR